jgi:hypothetical protein
MGKVPIFGWGQKESKNLDQTKPNSLNMRNPANRAEITDSCKEGDEDETSCQRFNQGRMGVLVIQG